MRCTFVVLSTVLAAANAFTAPAASTKVSFVSMKPLGTLNMAPKMTNEPETGFDPADINENGDELNLSLPTATAAIWAMTSTAASAAGPDWGIFEGRTLSLLHPALMAGMLLLSVSTAFLGFDWRRQRTIGDEINTLKKSLPDLGGASSVSEALFAAKSVETVDTALVAKLEASVATEASIKDLQTERKTLAEKGARDKHFSQGALLAFVGTLFAIEVRYTNCRV